MVSHTVRTLFLAGLLGVAAGPCMGQVVLSEVMINPKGGNNLGEQWIEVTNVSSSTVNMSAWCLYVATRKSIGTTMPGNYWWPFPKTGPGSLLPAGGTILINWLKTGSNRTVTNNPRGVYDEVFTGITVFDFLFGLHHYDTTKTPPESDMVLPATGGALGLVRTQNAAEVIQPGFWADFLEYGSAGWLREDLPVQAGIWTSGEFVRLPQGASEWPIGDSLVYAYVGNGALNYWRSRTPTPGTPNAPGATVSSYGLACPCKAGGKDLQCSLPVPAMLGNPDFKIVMNEGLPGSYGVPFLSIGKANIPFLGCTFNLNLAVFLALVPPVLVDASGQAVTPLAIPNSPPLLGARLFTQYYDVSAEALNGVFCASNALEFTIGGILQ